MKNYHVVRKNTYANGVWHMVVSTISADSIDDAYRKAVLDNSEPEENDEEPVKVSLSVVEESHLGIEGV